MTVKKGRTLSEEEVKRVQKALNRLLQDQTQKELAAKIHFSQSQISAVANGRRGGVSAYFAIALARELAVSPNSLIDMGNIEITPTSMPEMSVQSFLDWLYKAPGIMATAHRFKDLTIQDLFRLRESPPRGGEADPEQIYAHVLQLREGPIGDIVPHAVVEPAALLKLLPPSPAPPDGAATSSPSGRPKKKRRRTP